MCLSVFGNEPHFHNENVAFLSPEGCFIRKMCRYTYQMILNFKKEVTLWLTEWRGCLLEQQDLRQRRQHLIQQHTICPILIHQDIQDSRSHFQIHSM